MEQSTVQKPDEAEFMGIAYIALTSKYPISGDSPISMKQATDELMDVKQDMLHMAMVLGLEGRMAMIFCSLLTTELRRFRWAELICYCNIFHIMLSEDLLDVDDQEDVEPLVVVIFNEHIRRLQRLRMKRYAAAIFFGEPESREQRRPQVFFLDDANEAGQLLTEEEVREKGVDFWFPRVGGLRAELLETRFDFFEALYMLMLAGSLDPRDSQKMNVPEEFRFKITNDMQEADVYARLAGFYFDSRDDARGYVTVDGVMFPYIGEPTESFEPLNDVKILDMDVLQLLASQEGIDYRIADMLKPNIVIMFELCLSQLGSTFMSSFGTNRTIMEASAYETTSSKESPYYLMEDEIVCFGKRDGMSEVVIHTMEELCDIFVEIPDERGVPQIYAYDPISISNNSKNALAWIRYPRKTISRLLEIVLKSKRTSDWTEVLASKCRKVLASTAATDETKRFQDSLKKELKSMSPTGIKLILVRMFNSGLALAQIEVDPEEIFHDGITQREANDYVLEIEGALFDNSEPGNLIRKLLVVENYYNFNVMHYEDYNYEIGNFVALVRDMINLGLMTMVNLAGRYLANTASVLVEELYGHPINQIAFTFDEVGGEYPDDLMEFSNGEFTE